MSRLPQSHFIQGGYYHVFNRGNRKQDIFLDTKDYKRYIDKIKEYKQKHNVSIIAYCLMPNHIHLLLRQNGPEPLSILMQKLHTSYSKYFNTKYDQVGHVFQDRFKAKFIDNDEYLLQLSRYIHLNPLGLVTKLPSYKWSSYSAYITEIDDELTNTKLVLNFFKRKNQTMEDAKREYKLFVRSQEDYYYKVKDLTFTH